MATASEATELKVEGVVEAAENPNTDVSAEAAEHEIVEQSKNAGVAAFQFDPDASPAEKRAQAKAVRAPFVPFRSPSLCTARLEQY
jgi:hypothetical protein